MATAKKSPAKKAAKKAAAKRPAKKVGAGNFSFGGAERLMPKPKPIKPRS